jgi:hypothetical protein
VATPCPCSSPVSVICLAVAYHCALLTLPLGTDTLLPVADSKQIVLRCRWKEKNFKGKFVSSHDSKALKKWLDNVVTQHVEDILGIPTESRRSDFRYISVRDHRRPSAVSPRSPPSPSRREEQRDFLELIVTVHDGHAIFVDVHEMLPADQQKQGDDVIIHSIVKATNDPFTGEGFQPPHPSNTGYLERTDSGNFHKKPDDWQKVMELTSL